MAAAALVEASASLCSRPVMSTTGSSTSYSPCLRQSMTIVSVNPEQTYCTTQLMNWAKIIGGANVRSVGSKMGENMHPTVGFC